MNNTDTNITAKPAKLVKAGTFRKGFDPRRNISGAHNCQKEDLQAALQKAKDKEGTGFLDSYVARSYRDSAMAIALLKKLVPDLVEGDLGGDKVFIFKWKSDKKEENENLPILPQRINP